MTLTDLHLLAAPTSNVDAETEYKLSRALSKLFPAWQATRGSPPKPVVRASSTLRRLNPAPLLLDSLAIALGRKGTTSS
jgi:hypothetical protein